MESLMQDYIVGQWLMNNSILFGLYFSKTAVV